jgi:uncharacterized protein
MNKVKDKQYKLLVDYILNDNEFNKIGLSKHHGTNRLDHSIKVSYYSYLIAKKFGLDFESAATAGLLHDFFTTDDEKTVFKSIKSYFLHPKIASQNASNHFAISEKEKNIIETHMFPVNTKPTQYAEGWVVGTVDKLVCIFELSSKFKYALTLWGIFLLNALK